MSIDAMKKMVAALETCTEGDYSTGDVIHPSFDEKAVTEAIAAGRTAITEAEKCEPVAIAGNSEPFNCVWLKPVIAGTKLYTTPQSAIPDISLLQKAYLLGFNASGEGYNGEYPFGDNFCNPDDDANWIGYRDAEIEAMLAAAPKPENSHGRR